MACLLRDNSGFSLVELLIVFAIVILLVVGMIAGFNPINMSDRGYDARKKKDLSRIKVAFEEYFNDRGCYPTESQISSWGLENHNNCFQNLSVFPWLSPWPCSPSGDPYKIVTESSDCPKWFKVFTQLGNRNDSDIPDGWYDTEYSYILSGGLTADEVNYGTSSTNVKWYEKVIPDHCLSGGHSCSYNDAGGICQDTNECWGPNCFVSASGCHEDCRVNRCTPEGYVIY
ncbi:MAG: type II secretion system protein [Lentimicrobiaceae bacterium]|jgi:type II secretory pathway pseudopilin PulG|nr:type II secretion system protein [Lentimicrobiaceae bacterium]